MVLIDSDVFILDLFYPTDARAEANRTFLEIELPDRVTTVFNVLEICGIASFNKSTEDIEALFREFHQTYNLDILYPNAEFPSAGDLLKQLVSGTFARILRKMNFSDALILSVAESHAIRTLVTWNVKHFENRAEIRVLNPQDFLTQRVREADAGSAEGGRD